MKVIAHDHAPLLPSTPLFRSRRRRPVCQESRYVPFGLTPPVVPPVDHVVTRPGIFQSQLPRHALHSAAAGRFVKSQDMTPLAWPFGLATYRILPDTDGLA